MPTRPNRNARHGVAIVGLLLAALSLPLTAKAAPAGVASKSWVEPSAALPPQGLYEGCAPGTEGEACLEHLEAIRAAGFRYVLNYSSWYGSPAEVLRYADAAAALGLRLIWPLNNSAWRGLGSLDDAYTTFGGPATSPTQGSSPLRSAWSATTPPPGASTSATSCRGPK